jgi:hypothetical protein
MSESVGPGSVRRGGRAPLRIGAAGLVLFGALALGLRAQSSLFYIELQALGAYSTASDRIDLFSLMPGDVMQKPGLGFDFVQRLSAENRDIGVLAVQARLVYNQDTKRLQPQLYNAYLRFKPKFANIWIGHNRPAMGLASVLDNHALLLPDPTMFGYGFDRDWGVGLDRDFAWGGVAASLTTGCGMPLHFKGNYLAAARIFKGVLARDGYSFGLSLSQGNILETMGYMLVSSEPASWMSAGVDLSYSWRNLENRAEILLGRRGGAGTFLVFWRPSLSLLEEGRLKVELQPALMRRAGDWDYSVGSGLSYLFNADLAGRFMVLRDSISPGVRFAVQLYYYKRL